MKSRTSTSSAICRYMIQQVPNPGYLGRGIYFSTKSFRFDLGPQLSLNEIKVSYKVFKIIKLL